MTSPLILVNLKTFKEGMGNRAHMIATAAQLVARETGATIGVAPGYIDLHPLCHHFAIPVYAQHVDGYEPGARTRHIPVEALKLCRGSRFTGQSLRAAPYACRDRIISQGSPVP